MEQARKADQPFGIDRMPAVVQRAIAELYHKHGLTWAEIEALSAEPFGQRWDDVTDEDEDGNVSVTTPTFKVHPGRGFVPWGDLPLSVLNLFPELRIPKSNLHRWYKVRVKHVRQQMLEASERAREVAQAFAAATVEGGNEAVLNAARDSVMTVLAEDGTAKGKLNAAKALISLAEVMQGARANDVKERKVAADERRIVLLEQREKLAIQRLEAETERLAKKAESGKPITAEDLEEARKRTFGF